MVDTLKTIASVFVVLLLSLTGLSTFIIPRAQAASQGCVDIQATPVLQDSNWHVYNTNYSDFATKYEESSIIKSGEVFVLYVREDFNNSNSGIFRGTSTDGKSWKMSATPVLSPGPAGTWDHATVFSPDVVWNGTKYLMYYVGDGGNLTSARKIGVALSNDGISWTKYQGNPVITHGPAPYDARYTRGPSVIFDNGTYKMWYQGTSNFSAIAPLLSTIEYATSADGVHWMKYLGNPVFTGYEYKGNATAGWWPSVIKVNNTYVMAFSDSWANIGLATSPDGTTWKFNNQSTPLLALSGWHNGWIGVPRLFLDGQRLLLWYLGNDNSTQRAPYVGGVGMAACGILVVPPAVTTTNSVISVYTVRLSNISTSISTSIQTSTQKVTVVDNPNAPDYQIATAGAVGAVAALVVAASFVAVQLRRTRHSRPA